MKDGRVLLLLDLICALILCLQEDTVLRKSLWELSKFFVITIVITKISRQHAYEIQIIVWTSLLRPW